MVLKWDAKVLPNTGQGEACPIFNPKLRRAGESCGKSSLMPRCGDLNERAALVAAKDMLADAARLLQIAAHLELRLIKL